MESPLTSKLTINHMNINKTKFQSFDLGTLEDDSLEDFEYNYNFKDAHSLEDGKINLVESDRFNQDFNFEEPEELSVDSNEVKFVDDHTFYFHCLQCLTPIAGENELAHESKSFLKIQISNLIDNNIKTVNRFINVIYESVICRLCGSFVGIKYTPKDKESCCYLIENKIKINKEKVVTIGLLGLKADRNETIQKTFDEMFLDSKVKIKTVKFNQSKDSFQNFNSSSKELSQLDFLLIIHKVEGRLFLLGRNGFYNKICEQMYSKVEGNLFFLLLYKNIFLETDDLENNPPDQFQSDSINNLINKGDQKDLQIYKNENKIICLDDEKIEEDIQRRKSFFFDLFAKRFSIFKPYTINDYINTNNFIGDKLITKEEQISIDKLIKKISSHSSSESNLLKCFIL